MRIDDVITALGGPEATAKLFGVGRTSISNWKTFRRFPEYLHWRVVKECRKRGIDYDPAATEIDVRDTTHGGTSDTRSSNTKTHIEGQHGKQILNECDRNVAETVLPNNLANSDRDTAAANASDVAEQQPKGCGGSDEEGAAA